ncbi:MAG: DUF4139 domain-containing protein [Spirochaetaceae bacterium]|nr:DUF4139 domain-containing protein [Spirochaetaceae bacterium]
MVLKRIFLGFLLVLPCFSFAQNSGDQAENTDLPLKKASLFSSGVGYFEHRGTVAPNANVVLPFNANAVNDALKSLVINDPEAANPQVTYLSENSVLRTLRSLKIDLSGTPDISDILLGLRGADIQVTVNNQGAAPAVISGRIVAVGKNVYSSSGDNNSLSIATSTGIRYVFIKDIQLFSFSDPAINADMQKALDIISSSRESQTKQLKVSLTGRSRRNIAISYVIPTPVWKVSYRLDLNQSKPFLQGWAIIDNDGDTDWVNVELSLVTGRPVSFVQQLYPPYYTRRPTLPLAIAGIADAKTYDSGYADTSYAESGYPEFSDRAELSMMARETNSTMETVFLSAEQESSSYSKRAAPAYPSYTPLSAGSGRNMSVSSGVLDTMTGSTAGDQFEFTLKKPVTLARQQSTMLPLVEGPVLAEKTLVFSGQKAGQGVSIHPAISAQLTNNTGMKLPAGPITVFDGGTYAGDALIEFIPENEKRIISYGDDLAVSGTKQYSYKQEVSTVTVSKGVMSINRKNIIENTYVIRNGSSQSKKIIIEHPISPNTTLTSPAKSDEQTAAVYRFNKDLTPNGVLTFSVKEESPAVQTVALARLAIDSIVSYSTNGDIPPKVRTALGKAIELKSQAETETRNLNTMQAEMDRLNTAQDRIRKNIEAVGNTSEKGAEYTQRLAELDTQIDEQNIKMQTQRSVALSAQNTYQNYVDTLEL